jgi:flagellar biosynthesis component FlhA
MAKTKERLRQIWRVISDVNTAFDFLSYVFNAYIVLPKIISVVVAIVFALWAYLYGLPWLFIVFLALFSGVLVLAGMNEWSERQLLKRQNRAIEQLSDSAQQDPRRVATANELRNTYLENIKLSIFEMAKLGNPIINKQFTKNCI